MLRSFFFTVVGIIALVGCAASKASQSVCSPECTKNLSKGRPSVEVVEVSAVGERAFLVNPLTCSGPVEDLRTVVMEADGHFIPFQDGVVNPVTKTNAHGHTFIRRSPSGSREYVLCAFRDGCYPPKTGTDAQCEDRTRCCVLK